eukprot:TRINITY_DN67671_c0_g1_i1.p1 TRINITY_DN67671_c0_g1~~TRINITY_DN67671_c0_g1_i1.p1  ORF type:complete len:227 (-),score=49.54 TRINITY_DN67671_c0_g1_i1:270-893(-)
MSGIQKPAPAFSGDAVMPNGEFAVISNETFAGKYYVVVFIPLAFTFVCPSEVTAFSDRVEEFRANNCEVVFVSVDSKFSLLAWTEKSRAEGGVDRLNLPLVSDLTHKISRDFGVLLEDGPDAGVALRGLFIVDGKGILRHKTINDLPVGRSVDETLRVVQAFQFTDEHGEVCPAGWRPGAPTIKTDPKDKLEYFSKVADGAGAGTGK